MPLQFIAIAGLRLRLGECPVYDERTGRLYCVDILDRRIHSMDASGGNRASWTFESEVGSLGLAASGRLIVALRDCVILFDPSSEAREELCTIEAERPETRLNDGKVGPDGAFWVGSMDDRQDKQPIGALYRVDAAGRMERKVEGAAISNGLAWTANGELMFYADSRGPWIDRWRFDRRSGALSERTRYAEPSEIGRPDGGACDAEGYYWSAGVSAGRLNRFAPDGTLTESFEAPAPAPTMLCFGGADFRTLFLTSLTQGPDMHTASGGLFTAESPVAGFPPWRFLDI